MLDRFLGRQAQASARPSAYAWFASEPDATFELTDLRASVAQRHAIDLGFDAGPESFCAMVAARMLGRRSCAPDLVRAWCESFADDHWQRRYRFFRDPNGFPADTDSTAVALAALFQAGMLSCAQLLDGARDLLGCTPEHHAGGEGLRAGVVLVYWDDGLEPGVSRRGLKQDPVVAANVLYTMLLAEEAGLADPRLARFVARNLAYVRESLDEGSRVRTRYYPSPDVLLGFVAEVCARFARAREALELPLQRAVLARLHTRATATDDNALDLAMRLIAARVTQRSPSALRRRLLAHRDPAGSFPAGAFFTLGRLPDLCFGSSVLTTALAAAALCPDSSSSSTVSRGRSGRASRTSEPPRRRARPGART